jgi:hypothetical protein
MNKWMWWQFLGSRAIQVLYLLENFKRVYVTECEEFYREKGMQNCKVDKSSKLNGNMRIRHV